MYVCMYAYIVLKGHVSVYDSKESFTIQVLDQEYCHPPLRQGFSLSTSFNRYFQKKKKNLCEKYSGSFDS